MKITLGMLLDTLDFCEIDVRSDKLLDRAYRCVELFPKDPEKLKKDAIYLTDSYRSETILPVVEACSFRNELCLLYVHTADEPVFPECTAALQSELELAEILNHSVNVFFKYMGWEADLDACILKDNTVEEFLDIAVGMIGNPIQLYDPSLKLIASSTMDTDDMLHSEIRKYKGLTYKTAKYLDQIEFFPADDVHPSPILLYQKSPISPYTQLFYRIDISGKIIAVMYVVFSETEYSPRYIELVKLLGEKIAHATQQMDRITNATFLGYQYLMQDLIAAKELPQEEIEARAERVGLPYSASFYFLSIPILNDGNDTTPTEFFTRECESLHPNARALRYEDELLILIHFQAEGEAADRQFESFLHNLQPSLHERGLCAGYSRRFYTLSEVRLAYLQASSAYQLGRRLENSSFAREFNLDISGSRTEYYDYNDYVFAYMVYSFCQVVPYYSFCNMQLLELVKFARAANTNHVTVLFAYLICNCKLTETAEYLHMHRNNIVYHIRRIEEMLQLSLKDASVRVDLMITFQALCLME